MPCRFGMELDSLSDAVSFGLAPSGLLFTLHYVHWLERGAFWGFIGFTLAALPLMF
ncbi:MAG: hypothetical protein HOF72_04430, partial [Planctomycetaceae bacterium]|nr:hypothetical protein [Planctomycetaceae bacterium]